MFLVRGVTHKFRNLLFLSDFHEINFLCRIKNPQISNFMKILPLGAELFHFGGRTDRQIG
jgi:hypothetical protein